MSYLHICRSVSSSTLKASRTPCQLEYFFDAHDKMRSWKFKIYLPNTGQPFSPCRMIWHWQIDEAHSFSHEQQIVRYNIITMALVIGSEDQIQLCGSEARRFAMAFIRAWMNSLLKHDDFSEQNKFLEVWWSGGEDLMQFKSAQIELMKKRLKQLKSKVLPHIDVERFLNDDNGVDAKMLEEFGPAIALQWCLAQEFFKYKAEADNAAGDIDKDVMGLGLNEMEEKYDLEAVDWDWSPTKALMRDPEDVEVRPEPVFDIGRMWFSPSAAIELMGSQMVEAEKMLENLSL